MTAGKSVKTVAKMTCANPHDSQTSSSHLGLRTQKASHLTSEKLIRWLPTGLLPMTQQLGTLNREKTLLAALPTHLPRCTIQHRGHTTLATSAPTSPDLAFQFRSSSFLVYAFVPLDAPVRPLTARHHVCFRFVQAFLSESFGRVIMRFVTEAILQLSVTSSSGMHGLGDTA